MRTTFSRDGDTADLIAGRELGAMPGATEALLEANAGLAALGVLLPAGLEVLIPDPPAPARPATVRLWGAS